MREYLYELKHNDALVTSIIPLGDGVALSVKKEVGLKTLVKEYYNSEIVPTLFEYEYLIINNGFIRIF